LEFLITALAGLGVLSLFDDLLGNRLGLGIAFSQGFAAMGRLALSITGFYSIGISFVQRHAASIGALTAGLPFDPSLLPCCILCSDSGGLPIAFWLAASLLLGIYTGALIGSGLGAMVSFQMPVFLSALAKEEFPAVMRGFVYGLCTLPLGLAAGGFLLNLTFTEWVIHTIPVLLLCAVLITSFLTIPEKTLKALIYLGSLIRLFSYGLFALVIAGIFIPSLALTDVQLVKEAMYLTLRTTMVACGGLTAAKLATRFFSRPLDFTARLLGINHEAVIGLLLGCFQSVAMLPLFPEMDRRGKIMNAAFSVCGAFMLGGQMAFVAQMVPSHAMAAYLANKLVCGISAIALTWLAETYGKSGRRFTVISQNG